MANALQRETSPYLLQHADNPVDWMPWGPEALARARATGKPILLSIGYSACHWCHVMAHESFEDAETAALMNELFVNIKVDREERPDLDRIYQTCQQLFTGRAGGWPLTVFLTPDEQWPFFAGTYFPKTAAYGMPAFREVLARVADYFRHHRSEIDANAGRLLEALDASIPTSAGAPEGDYRTAARRRLRQAFDTAHGGFGDAPKFPHPGELGLLLELAPENESARTMVETSLRAMIAGGLFDHLGGGFFRYCVDRDWRIPHFEKMLYDNAALLGVTSRAFAVTDDPLYRGAAEATADWLLGTMRDTAGAFYSTLDADSDGEEGKYYCFDHADLEAVLDADELFAATHYFGLDGPPNFEQRAWHLQPRERVLPYGAAGPAVERAREKLLAMRSARTTPGRDDKILTAWNGLLIGQLAIAARCLDRPDLGEAAREAVDFIHEALWRDGRLLACYKDGQSRFPAYLDDYALMALGLVELMQWDFRRTDLDFAQALVECLLAHFSDPRGGFYFTADDHEQLIHRPKPLADESLPSGNGAAALALDTLGHLLGEPRYLEAAAATVRAAMPSIARIPEAHATLLRALDRLREPPEILIVRAPRSALADWRPHGAMASMPTRLDFLIADEFENLPGLLATREAADGPTAWLCRGTACLAPIRDPGALHERLGASGAR